MLEPKKSPYFDKPTQVCLTSLRAMALFYLIRNYEYAYGYTWQGKLYFDDPFPDALKKLYAGKSGWLYFCEEGNYERTEIPNEFVSAQPVRILRAEYIPDAYEAFLREQEAGNILLLDYADSDRARYYQENYPEIWKNTLKSLQTEEEPHVYR